jgi:hypothetical protein
MGRVLVKLAAVVKWESGAHDAQQTFHRILDEKHHRNSQATQEAIHGRSQRPLRCSGRERSLSVYLPTRSIAWQNVWQRSTNRGSRNYLRLFYARANMCAGPREEFGFPGSWWARHLQHDVVLLGVPTMRKSGISPSGKSFSGSVCHNSTKWPLRPLNFDLAGPLASARLSRGGCNRIDASLRWLTGLCGHGGHGRPPR